MAQLVAGRTCGGCTACCKTHAVQEVNTGNGDWCRHCAIDEGCRIYSRRPGECGLYECVWLKGHGVELNRPDRLGIVMDCCEVDVHRRKISVLNLWEVERGDAHQVRIRQFIFANLEQGFVVRVRRTVDPLLSPTGIGLSDQYFYPDELQTASERALFREAMERRESSSRPAQDTI